jgi:transcriptional regulator with GAF, ATPase, and Fis domain
MATLRMQLPGKGVKVYHIYKKITSLGRSDEADIVLPDPLLAESHAHIHFDGRDFNIATTERDAELFVNGRKRNKHRLTHEDRIRLGMIELEFSLYDEPVTDESAARTMAELNSYKKLLEFSQKLMGSYELPALLDQLLDVMIQVSNADKGFLVLMESGEPVVKVARNLRRETISDAVSQLSDSIIARVVKSRKPLIISDALSDAEFKNSLSVVNLKLTSVMCVPLLERGNMLGVIYVGNDHVAQLFDQTHLEIMMVFAAQASLLVRNALLVNELKLDNRSLHDRIEQIRFGEILGASPRMQEVFRKVQKVATTDISVLITGETGTGTELIARELHARSPRTCSRVSSSVT